MSGTTAEIATDVLDVMYRPPGGGHWKRITTVTCYKDAVKLITGRGDYWFRRAGGTTEAAPLVEAHVVVSPAEGEVAWRAPPVGV
jgi:hypothetical protein